MSSRLLRTAAGEGSALCLAHSKRSTPLTVPIIISSTQVWIPAGRFLAPLCQSPPPPTLKTRTISVWKCVRQTRNGFYKLSIWELIGMERISSLLQKVGGQGVLYHWPTLWRHILEPQHPFLEIRAYTGPIKIRIQSNDVQTQRTQKGRSHSRSSTQGMGGVVLTDLPRCFWAIL